MDTSYSCLGIVLHLLGDYNGAREAFQLARYDDTVSFRGRLNLRTKTKHKQNNKTENNDFMHIHACNLLEFIRTHIEHFLLEV